MPRRLKSTAHAKTARLEIMVSASEDDGFRLAAELAGNSVSGWLCRVYHYTLYPIATRRRPQHAYMRLVKVVARRPLP